MSETVASWARGEDICGDENQEGLGKSSDEGVDQGTKRYVTKVYILCMYTVYVRAYRN